jgi:hypothetical protein
MHSAKCAFSAVSETIYARPLERGGSVKPRSFCLSLKFASIQRYSVLIQLKRDINLAAGVHLDRCTY